MTDSFAPDVRAGRLESSEYTRRFAEVTPCLSAAQALLEAERCLYCFDAPCTQACPTQIDVPSFIRRIADHNLRGAAKTILQANPLGGMCARVCPTETLCEAACVRQTQEGRPVAIGRLQRHAVDALMQSTQPQPFSRAAASGKTVAVVGAGPAGLACAHALSRLGHQVTVFDARPKAGGLNEYGLASYKMSQQFAQDEVQWLLSLGGMRLQTGWKLETAEQLETLRREHDAVFLGLGLAATPALAVPGEELNGVRDAVDFIAELRQCQDLSTLPVGKSVVVIGGGMTAIDAAVQAKLLGAHSVHLVYRRGPEQMTASRHEQQWAQTQGVVIEHWLAPVEIIGSSAAPPVGTDPVRAVRFAPKILVGGQLQATGQSVLRPADMVLKAIGQSLGNPLLAGVGLTLQAGRIATDATGLTSLAGVWAGGDSRAGGLDLTVQAVAHGLQSAQAIHRHLLSL